MKKLTLTTFAVMFVSLFLSAQESAAADPQNPTSLCERFVTPIEKEDCVKRVEKIKPDWYLASICSKQYEDASFYRCLELSKSAQFSPKKLEACDDAGLNDSQRMTCLQAVASSTGPKEVYQDRKPTAAEKRATRFENRR